MKIDKSQCGNTLAFYVYVGKDLSNSDKVELGGRVQVFLPNGILTTVTIVTGN
ncbi:hypothetical protein [Providencia heimbachae]|uniref:hypothetical protein n=1 Tax=Providencia heimbachae TaxID=333962 RepID=UPI0015868376|nr:hypothetical protein [Providencia heimbachae]